MNDLQLQRRERLIRGALHIQLLSVGWIMTEAALSAVAAVRMGSLALSAFSVDSAIELISSMVLVVRLWTERQTGTDAMPQSVERAASAIVGTCLFVLAGYVAWKSGQSLALREPLQFQPLGLAVAGLSSMVTPWFAVQKRRFGRLIDSHALLGDAACSTICAYMAWTLLAGLLLQWLFGWWWVDPVAACGILYFVQREAWESLGAAWSGKSHVHAH